MISLLPDLSKRAHEPELMDFQDADQTKLINTVKQFTLINHLFTGAKSIIKKTILKDLQSAAPGKYTLLDIGSGGCDISRWMIKQTRKLGINLSITCLDNDNRILPYAKKVCRNYPEIGFIQASAFSIGELPEFDYMFTNHFLHHLVEQKINSLIQLISSKTKRIFVLNDIRRSYWSYIGYSLFTGIFLKNSFAFYDGRLSIRKGFTPEELRKMVKNPDVYHTISCNKVIPSHIAVVGRKEC